MEREAMQRLRLSNMWVLSVQIRPRCFYWKISRRFYPVLNHRYLLRCRGMYVFLPIRYLSYIKINAQSYRYGSAEKGVNVAKTLAPLVWPIPVGAMVRGGYVSPGLELSVDYTLCLYDISTQTTLVMHPFLFETEQSKKDRRKIQLMQPEGVPVDYPLIDELHEALVAEYDILLKKLGIK